ncbi:acyl-CoA dehydrogenase family protein [Roseibium salinum]
MVHHTRLDTAMAPAGLMRAALSEAHHWVTHRTAFQKRLIDQPLMRTVLADLALDLEGSLALGLHMARATDGKRPEDRAFARIGVALAKYLSNKLCPQVVVEAMEVLGGSGYVEESTLPLLYREAPLNGIWEGSGNIICLDALRTLAKQPLSNDGLTEELEAGAEFYPGYRAALENYRQAWPRLPDESLARAFIEHTALLLTASVLVRTAPAEIAEAFILTRLSGQRGRTPGAAVGLNAASVLSRLSS